MYDHTQFETIRDSLIEAVTKTIESKVNGKIDKIKHQLDLQDHILTDIREDISAIKGEQVRLKSDTDPLIDDRKVISGVGRFVLWLGAIVLTIGGVFKLFK